MRGAHPSPETWLDVLASRMRARPTAGERLLYRALKRQHPGLFTAQTPLCGYIPDLLADKLRLVVEIDGPHHLQPAQRAHDETRDRHLRAAGYDTLRFTHYEVMHDLDRVLSAIRSAVESRKLKATQAFTRKQRICGMQEEIPPRSPGSRGSGGLSRQAVVRRAPSKRDEPATAQEVKSA